MRRFSGLLFTCLVVASPIFARVLSYAPYTNRVALPSFQDRASRHFILIEAKHDEYFWSVPRDLVLYDSTGEREPRVLPAPAKVWSETALYEKNDGEPVILAFAYGTAMISDGGTDWRPVQGLGPYSRVAPLMDVDTGGPFVHGLFAPILPGNEEWPFVVTLSNEGVWAIGRTGVAKQLFPGATRVVGRNAAGDRFLIQSGNSIWTAAPGGEAVRLVDLPANGSYAGWLTSNGTAYLERLFLTGRTLYVTSGTSVQMIATGPPVSARATEPLPIRTFAIPTHDYEGAWILERAPNEPTRLLRHTPSSGLETMWSDAASPEVEALIAGKSGQTVLVQVHRDRPGAAISQPIIDPALAVWRIGHPAPRVYDELYVREEWNKGFVIVDADKLDSFVFDSGFKGIVPPPGRVSAPIGGGGDVVQEWGVVRGSFEQKLVLPGVARLRGAYDSSWQTDAVLYNPLPEAQKVEVRFAPTGMESSVTTTVTLDAREIRAIPDVLHSLFFIENGGGALHLVPEIGINATARTYSRRGGGTYGYGMHAIDAFNAAGPRFALTFSGAFPGDNFRTNVMLTDTSGRGTHANLRTIKQSQPVSGAGAFGTFAMGAMQATLADPERSHADDGVTLVVEPTRGTAIATVVAIDNRSNDATWFPPDLPGSVPRAIPVIGHLDGANGTKWRSDLYLHNPRDGSRYVIVTARLWDDPSHQYVAWLRLYGRETRVVRDALQELFGLTGIARIRYASAEDEPGEGVRVTSRTYTVDASGATYGCLVPPLNGFQIATPGDRLEILGAGGGAGFRTNIGLVDVSDSVVQDSLVRITIVGDRREVLASFLATVPAQGGVQLNDVFRARGIDTPPAALIVVENVDGSQIAAYATLVDNVTNDSTYLAPQLGAKETN